MTIDANQKTPMSDERLQFCLEMVQDALNDLKAKNITVQIGRAHV